MRTQTCKKIIEIALKNVKDKYDRDYIRNYLEAEISRNKAMSAVRNRNQYKRYWEQKETKTK